MRFMLVATLVLVVIITVVDAGGRHRVRNGIRRRYFYGRQAYTGRRYRQRLTWEQISCNKIKNSKLCSRCCAVDGNWGPWSGCNPCSVTCGTGTQSRTRSCDNPAPAYGGGDCHGDGIETRSCNMIDCPVPRPLCENKLFNVVILVDASANITDEEIGQERDLLQQLYSELSIDGDDRRFGFTAHGGATAFLEFDRLRLAKVDDITTQQVRINDLEKIGGKPFLAAAINTLEMDFDYSERAKNPNVRKIGILIAAAETTPINIVTPLVNDVKAQNISMYAVGIGDRVSEEFVQAIATNPTGAINTGSSQLNEAAAQLKQLICF